MSSLLSGINARFRGAGRTGRSPGPGPEGPSQPPSAPPPPGPATTASSSIDGPVSSWPRPLPAWLNRASAKHIVKGNFMTLSARPKTVEPGEWIAHQVVEHYRVLWNFVRVIHEKDDDGKTICNRTTCPKMSAGKNHSYTWLNKNHEAVELPAYEYITLMQRWIAGKVDDINVFPTDPAGVSYAAESAPAEDDWVGRRSGFPKEFLGICRTIFLQMFRVYAHLFWDHFLEPFYHLNLEKSLNSCFSHFILTATTLDLLKLEDIEPMKPLIDLWAADGTFPPESKAYTYADVEQGKELMELSPAA